ASSQHAHHCVQLILALTGTLHVRQPRARWFPCGAVIIPADAPHEVRAHGAQVLIGFIDRESEIAGALLDPLKPQLAPVDPGVVARWRHALGNPSALQAERVEDWVRSLRVGQPRRPRIHPAIRRVIRDLRSHPLNPRATTLARLAQLAGLSPSRFMHVFTESIGIPLRRYLLWLRVQRAVGSLAAG